MRILYVFLLLFFLVGFCDAQVQNKSIDVKMDGKKFSELVTDLESRLGVRFYYGDLSLDTLTFNLNLNNVFLDDVLKKVLINTSYKYAVFENNIFITKINQIYTVLPSQFTGKTPTIAFTPKPVDDDFLNKKTKISAAIENKLYTIGTSKDSLKKTANLSGFIKNPETGEPISGVTLFISNSNYSAISDRFGFYTILFPKGKQELNISAFGFKTSKRQINLLGDGKLDINLQEQLLTLKEVVITSNKVSNITRNQMGIEKIDIKTIKQIPTAFGETDILRVVLSLPGVKSVGESSTGLNVRGGSVDQNLILFNDATVFNPAHFFGFFSAFNPEVVKDVQLYKSSIPSKYGGRLSSVLEINSREGNKKNFAGSAGIGLVTSRLNLEGPIIKDKTSFIFGGRTTYSNWMLDLLPDNSAFNGAKASFYDLNLNVSHQHNEKNNFYFTGYLSNDQSNLATDTTFQYSNQNISLRWKHIFNNKLYGVVSGGYDRYYYDNFSNFKEDVDYRLKFNVAQSNLKANFIYDYNSDYNIEFGASTINYSNKPGSLNPLTDKSLVIPNIIQHEQAFETAAFIEQNYDISDAISVTGGLRYSMYNFLGPTQTNVYANSLTKNDANIITVDNYGKGENVKTYHGPEYRLATRVVLNPNLSFKASFNTQRQYIHMLSNTTSISPTDVWKLSDLNIAPQRGSQFSLGIYKNFKSNTIETSIEGYYKNTDDFLDFKSGAVLVLNPKIEQDVLPTQGKAYGVEFLVKKLTGKLNGWLSYTYSRTLLKTEDKTGVNSINGGVFYPANYDKPHDVTMISNFRFTHRVSLSFNLTYSTGRPITLPVGKYFYAGAQRLLFSDRNQYRIPDYFRSDFSLNVLGNHRKTQAFHNSWTFGVYNLTGRNNVFSSFFATENNVINGYQLSIFATAIPFINYNIRFR